MPKSKRAAKKNSKPTEVTVNEEVNEIKKPVYTEEEEAMTEKIESTESTAVQGEEVLNGTDTITKQECENTLKTSVYLQYAGNEYDEAVIIENIKNAWTGDTHDVSEINTIEVYIKPEELCVYYVINGTDQGSVAL